MFQKSEQAFHFMPLFIKFCIIGPFFDSIFPGRNMCTHATKTGGGANIVGIIPFIR